MFLKVGELARRTGLTVRALHHYDSIGLLCPSGRSEGGYRLYSRDDVARLHGIQTLRRMGLSLGDVAQLLDGGAVTLPAILAQQIGVLDQEIAQAQALRERLAVMQIVLAGGGQPEIDDWLTSLSMMSTLEQYFSAAELKLIFERWKLSAAEWPPLLQAIRDAMVRGVPPDSIEVQPLARRWMDVSARWMNGDVALLTRWRSMLLEQSSLPLPSGMDRALIEYIGQAIEVRLAVLSRYITEGELQRLDNTLDPEWRALAERAERLMADGAAPDSAEARQLAREWKTLQNRMVRDDAALRARLLAAYQNEPLIRAGTVVTPQAWRYLEQAAALDTDAT
jgi:MerR family transcriptional regulator, thiopeptide resistance regulator